MSTQNQARVTVTVDGRDCGTFSKREGGGTDSDVQKYRRGGGEPKIAVGGSPDVDTVKLTSLQELTSRELIKFLRSRCGKGVAEVTEQPLDEDDHIWGAPDTWTGKLKSAKSADFDANSSDVAEWEIEIEPDETTG